MKRIGLIFALLLSTLAHAQYEITIEALILDKETNAPIPYVNIGFVGKSIGTVTNEDGQFTLIYEEDLITLKDQLQISALGYETVVASHRQLMRLLTNTTRIYLEAQPEYLDEVFLTNEKREEIRIGHTDPNKKALGYWKDKNALGGEIATKIKIKHKKTKLLDFKFNIVENITDSLKIRVNIYDFKRGYPGIKLLKQNILTTVVQKEGVVTIDLSPYNIKVDDDIVIGIELVKVYGENIEFAISGEEFKGTAFRRFVSQDNWTRYSDIGMNFSVLTSIAEKNGEKVSSLRDKPNKISLYWDSSLSMKERNLNEELNLLQTYFKTLKNTHVEVIKFNSDIVSTKIFKVEKGKNDDLFEHLKNTFYEGANNYDQILKQNTFNADVALLFTDGITTFQNLQPEINVPVFTINSLPNANHHQLQRAAFYADGHYLNLNTISSKLAIDFMLNEVPDQMDYLVNDQKEPPLTGKVFSVIGPIQGAIIRVKNTYIEAQSDVDGFFNINADVDDTLVVNYLGMVEKEVVVTNPQNIAILLKPDGELLDEVLLKGEGKKDEEVDTGYGKKDKKILGYSVNTITSDEIGPQYNTLADLIVGRFAGVQVAGLNVAYNTPKFIIRGGGGSLTVAYAMLDIDGTVYDSSQDAPSINIHNIESISVLKSTAATNRYGAMGRGGAIVIKSKSLRGENGVILDTALIEGNDYSEEGVLFLEAKDEVLPEFLLKLNKATNFDEALSIYKNLKEQGGLLSIPFYFDVSDYFMKWDSKFAYSVLTNIASVAGENTKALKALAFKMEALNKNKDAQSIYERLATLRPKHEQSYRDLARIYALNEEYTKAMNLYKRMLAMAIEDVEFIGLQRTIENELMHLLAFNRSKVEYQDLPIELRTAKFKYDIRIVFEWTDSNTEFEFQFVNPQKKYFKWSHSKFANKERLIDEITYGYNTEEFIIDDAEAGEWIINIECLSGEALVNPTYLKYTVFKNYGQDNETKEIKVIKLYKQTTKVTLDKFMYQ